MEENKRSLELLAIMSDLLKDGRYIDGNFILENSVKSSETEVFGLAADVLRGFLCLDYQGKALILAMAEGLPKDVVLRMADSMRLDSIHKVLGQSKNKLVVGVTGGIGSGKSTIVQAISKMYDVPTYFVDIRSAHISDNHPEVVAAIKERFGEGIYGEDGKLKRMEMGDIVFKDESQIAFLTELLTKPILADIALWKAEQEASQSPYLLVESAVFHETKTDGAVDIIVGVDAPLEKRIERVASRAGGTVQRAHDRISKQMPNEDKMGMCDLVISGDSDIFEECKKLHRALSKIAKLKR